MTIFKNHTLPIALVLAFILSINCISGQKNDVINTISGKTITENELNFKIDSIIKAIEMPGLSIAIINDSSLKYHGVFGVTQMEEKTLVDDQTIFEAASLSKPIFAYFALKMVDRGILDLDKPLYEYIPHPGIAEDSKEDYKLITARMVLSHRTGFPNHSNGKLISLAFKPGTDFMYSGEAFQYLAAVIAKLRNVDLNHELNMLFQHEVTQPLNMMHSTFVWDDYLEKHKAYGHDSENKSTQNNPKFGGWSCKSFNAYSSLHSEAQEYAQFLIALLKQQGLKSDTFKDMFAEHSHFKDDNPLKQQVGQTGWGLGMAQKNTPYGTMHMHTGNNHDFQSYMMILPEKKFGIVFFTNSDKAIPLITALNEIIGPIF